MALTERVCFGAMVASTAAARGAVALRGAFGRRPPPPPPEGPLRALLVASHPSGGAGTKYRLRVWGDRLRAAGHHVQLALPARSERALRLYRDWSPGARAEYHLRVLANRVGAVWGAGRPHVTVLHMTDLPHWEYGPGAASPSWRTD
jgi:hypothetical protein